MVTDMRVWRIICRVITILGALGTSTLDWAGRADFVRSHWADRGWLGDLMSWLIDPPWWLPSSILLFGLSFWAWLEFKIRHQKTTPEKIITLSPAGIITPVITGTYEYPKSTFRPRISRTIYQWHKMQISWSNWLIKKILWFCMF
jgi:hypothetical protein